MNDVKYDQSDESLIKQLKKYWLTWYEKNGVGPGDDKMKKKMDTIYRQRDKQNERQREVYQSIADMLSSNKFIANIQHDTFDEINSKVQRFL